MAYYYYLGEHFLRFDSFEEYGNYHVDICDDDENDSCNEYGFNNEYSRQCIWDILEMPLEQISDYMQKNPGWISSEQPYCYQTPLHSSILQASRLEVVRFLYESYPDAIRKVDKDWQIPLHSCVQFKVPTDVFDYI
jgi:hypothetical protein